MENIRREYKDSVFRMYFGHNKEALLSIYNALNDTDYSNPDALEVNTLENAIFMGIHNDISFVLGLELNLYEHQSSVNPNIPLRNLFYAADLLQKITGDMNIYGHKKLVIPTPRFVVFYNGIEKLPERCVYRLSDLYGRQNANAGLELVVNVININEGYNGAFLDKCSELRAYSQFVAVVRKYGEGHSLGEAMEMAIDECIRRDILRDFLKKNKSEVIKVSIYEYDYEKHMRLIREEGIEEGFNKGEVIKLISMINRKTRTGCTPEKIADDLMEDIDTVTNIYNIIQTSDANLDERQIYDRLVSKS